MCHCEPNHIELSCRNEVSLSSLMVAEFKMDTTVSIPTLGSLQVLDVI